MSDTIPRAHIPDPTRLPENLDPVLHPAHRGQNHHAGRAHDERVAARAGRRQASQEAAGGEMAVEGSESNAHRSHGELSDKGKQVWRTGAGIDGGGKSS
jgi:hypothetical protein